MNRKGLFAVFFAALAAISISTAAPALAQNADPTLDQVYRTANSGQVGQALNMMDQVLRDHPNSARAHYVEAQLLARDSRYSQAGSELSAAERIAPGLPFVQPQELSELRNRIASQGRSIGNSGGYGGGYANGAPSYSRGVHFGGMLTFLVIGAIVVFLIVTLVRATRRVMPVMSSGPGYLPGGPAVGGGMPVYPMGGMPMGGMPMGGGIGSGIVGGLATGAALGAGLVAGEELMHHVLDPSHPNYVPPQSGPIPDNMGGQDFGVADPGSGWDDSGSSLSDGLGGGGGDWN